jgi:hypothetical protein
MVSYPSNVLSVVENEIFLLSVHMNKGNIVMMMKNLSPKPWKQSLLMKKMKMLENWLSLMSTLEEV